MDRTTANRQDQQCETLARHTRGGLSVPDKLPGKLSMVESVIHLLDTFRRPLPVGTLSRRDFRMQHDCLDARGRGLVVC